MRRAWIVALVVTAVLLLGVAVTVIVLASASFTGDDPPVVTPASFTPHPLS